MEIKYVQKCFKELKDHIRGSKATPRLSTPGNRSPLGGRDKGRGQKQEWGHQQEGLHRGHAADVRSPTIPERR